MQINDFRKHAHQLVDWMADYYEQVEQYPVKSQSKPGEIAAQLPLSAPQAREPMENLIKDFQSIILPGMTHWQHPNFFAYFPASASPPSLLAEMLISTLAAQCMSWQTSPAATELETRVMDWLRQMIGLPEGYAGVIQDTASTATLCAILSAREKISTYAGNKEGLFKLTEMRIYASNEVHSSIDKAVRIAGLGQTNLVKIPVDDQFSLRPEALEKAIQIDIANGKKPACVIATIGSTSCGAVDSIDAIGKICQRYKIWLHVDAAWAGSALILPEFQWMIKGCEAIDSLVFNPHKWLMTQFDCSAYFVREPADLVRTFEILPEYLKTKEGDQVINYRDWGIQLGRRFRALKLWFVLRSYGVEGLQQHLRNHISWAQMIVAEIQRNVDFELLAPAHLSLVCFRYRPASVNDEQALDQLNQTLFEQLNDSGKLYLTHTKLNGKYTIRFVVGATLTQAHHVDKAWTTIKETARSL